MPPTFSSMRALKFPTRPKSACQLRVMRPPYRLVIQAVTGTTRAVIEGEPGIDGGHQHEGADERHDGDQQVFGTVVRHFADLFEVLGDPRHEVPGLLLVIEAERELLQVIEALAAHLGLDVDPEPMAPIGHDREETGVERIDDEQRGRGQRDQPPVLPGQQTVDEGSHRERKAEFEQARHDGAGESRGETARGAAGNSRRSVGEAGRWSSWIASRR